MFQAVPPPIIRSSNCVYSFWYLSNCNNIINKLLVITNIALSELITSNFLIILLQFDKYQKLYVQSELLMMGGGTA
jgi:hypothetical protein